MNETNLKLKVMRWFKKAHPKGWLYHPSDSMRRGLPDLIIVLAGKTYAIELKVGKNKATKLQLHTLKKMAKAGAITAVCYSLDQVKQVIEHNNTHPMFGISPCWVYKNAEQGIFE